MGATSDPTVDNATIEDQQKRSEIYTYEAPWHIYAMNWSVRRDKNYRLAISSLSEQYPNRVEIVQLHDSTSEIRSDPIPISPSNTLTLPPIESDPIRFHLVIEGPGVFVDREGAGKHIHAGAKKMLITAPGKGAIPTYVVGVIDELYSHGDDIISDASCTTNCLAPFIKVLDQKFGIIKGTMTTTHSYTGDQRLLDTSNRDLRRARAAARNIVPTSAGAAKAVALVLPNLKGKLNGIALCVPTPNVSVVDLVVQVTKKSMLLLEKVPIKNTGILAVCDEPLFSVDFRCSDVSSTVDSSLTMVMCDCMVKVIVWYDNEWGWWLG